MTRQTDAVRQPGILSGPYVWVTLGMCALVVLSAFEALAIMTAMPLVTADLDGRAWYALAFSAPLAAGVIGMVIAGDWADRRGPRAPLYACVAALTAGLVVAGTATTMEVFVAGRLVQGMGGGAITIPLYVIVARIYPDALRPRIFASFAAAWVVPSLVGPVIAGAIAETFGWRWVFLGVVVLVAAALATVIIALRGRMPRIVRPADPAAGPGPWRPSRLGWAALAAAAVLALTLSADLTGAAVWLVAVPAVLIAAGALVPLVPHGTLRSARGLPSVIVVRLLMAAGFFGAEAYVPYLLVREYDFSAAYAGLALTGSGIAWASASWLQGRLGLSSGTVVRIGAAVLVAGVLLVAITPAMHLPWAAAIAGWIVTGLGMGFGYPRLSVLTLEYSNGTDEGFNSSALAIADSIGAAAALAFTAIAVAAAGGTDAVGGGAASFTAAFAVALAGAVGGALLASRVHRPETAVPAQ